MANKPDHHHHHHQSSRRLMLVLYFTSVLGIGFIAAFLCLSSSIPSVSAVFSIWVPVNRPEIQIPIIDSKIVQKRSKQSNDTKDHVRFLSAIFADIPAPELKWEEMESAPVPRLDGYSVQINNLLYVFSGYGSLDYVRNLRMIIT
jgi:hypothetical protein